MLSLPGWMTLTNMSVCVDGDARVVGVSMAIDSAVFLILIGFSQSDSGPTSTPYV